MKRVLNGNQHRALTAPKPLENNNGAQAGAQANYNYKIEKENEPLPLPRKGEASCSQERGGNLSANPSLPSLVESQKASQEESPNSHSLKAHLSLLSRTGVRFPQKEWIMKDSDWISIWHSLALTLIDCGYLSVAILEKEAVKRRWKGRMIAEVAKALSIEAFEYQGETYWRLSEKVVPFVPRRDFSVQSAAQA